MSGGILLSAGRVERKHRLAQEAAGKRRLSGRCRPTRSPVQQFTEWGCGPRQPGWSARESRHRSWSERRQASTGEGQQAEQARQDQRRTGALPTARSKKRPRFQTFNPAVSSARRKEARRPLSTTLASRGEGQQAQRQRTTGRPTRPLINPQADTSSASPAGCNCKRIGKGVQELVGD